MLAVRDKKKKKEERKLFPGLQIKVETAVAFPGMWESASLYFTVNKAEHFETHFSRHPTCKWNTSSMHMLHCDPATGASHT